MNLDKSYFDKRINEVIERIDMVEQHLKLIERKDRLSDFESFLDVKDVKFILGVDERTVYRLRKEKQIKSFKMNGRVQFLRQDVLEYVKENIESQQ